MQTFKENDPVWLVKSSGLILGPYSLVELSQALKERRVALLDEVRTPGSRWGFVRESAQLADLVRIIREAESRQNLVTGKTKVESEPDDSDPTQSLSVTLRVIETTPVSGYHNQDEVTKYSNTNATNKKNLPATVPSPMGRAKPTSIAPINLSTAGIFQDQSEGKKTSPLFVGLVLALIGIGAYFWMSRDSKKANVGPKLNPSVEMISLAKKNKDLGFYDKSLMMYERASAQGTPSGNVKFEMIPLLIREAKNYPKAQELIKELGADSQAPAELSSQLENWSGLLMMKQGQFSAAEAQLRAAAEKFSNLPSIQINRVINFYFAGQFDSSLQLAKTLNSQNIKSPMISLAEAFSMLALNAEKFVPAEAQKVMFELNSWSESRRDLTFECSLASAALAERLGIASGVKEALDRLVEQSIGITHLFIRELDVDDNLISWSQLKTVCENFVKNNVGKDPKALALQLHCEIEGEKLELADGDALRGLQKFPGDPYLQSVRAAIMKLQGRPHDVKEVTRNLRTRPGLILRAQVCLDQKDLLCADDAVRLLAERDRNDVENIFELTQLNLLRDKRDFAGQFAERGLKLTPNFKPLLEIREEMGEL